MILIKLSKIRISPNNYYRVANIRCGDNNLSIDYIIDMNLVVLSRSHWNLKDPYDDEILYDEITHLSEPK